MSDIVMETLKARKKHLLSERTWAECRVIECKTDLEESEQIIEERDFEIAKINSAILQLGGHLE